MRDKLRLNDLIMDEFVTDETMITVHQTVIINGRQSANYCQGRWFSDNILNQGHLTVKSFAFDSLNNQLTVDLEKKIIKSPLRR